MSPSCRLQLGLLATILLSSACFGGGDQPGNDEGPRYGRASQATATAAPSEWSGSTVRVPQDHGTVQEAVDAASPGDLLLIDRGVYRERVRVTTPGLVIRGVDRDEVVLDGERIRENGFEILADGVAVENLTTRDFTLNGVFWNGVRGYRASYVTVIDNADYGIYAFDSTDGLFEHSYASGSPDAGFYIGQCDPCEAVVTDVVAEWNGLGYSGTNASGDIYIVRSTWRSNHGGVMPNSLDSELLPPAHDVTIVGNLVSDNDNLEAPVLGLQWAAHGVGIALAGVEDSLVARNRVINHAIVGIAAAPLYDRNFWVASGNRVEANVVRGNGYLDIALVGPASLSNCFEGNQADRVAPPGLHTLQGCDGLRVPLGFDLGPFMHLVGRFVEDNLGLRPDPPVGRTPEPGPQPELPGGAEAPVVPAVDVFASHPLDLGSIALPDALPGTTIDQPRGLVMFGVLFASVVSVFFGLYGYFLPFALYAAWLAIALWDLARRDGLSKAAILGWVAVVLVVPFLGVIAYYLFARSPIPAWQRAAFVGGGLVAYLVVLVVGALVGGLA